MTMLRRPLYFVLPLLVAVTACERAATDPSIPEEYIAGRHQPGTANTLPVLFGDALLKIQRQQGTAQLESTLARWTALQDEVRVAHANGDRKSAQAKLHALHAEEVRLIVHTFGPSIVTRVISESSIELAAARTRIAAAAASGAAVTAAETGAQQVSGMLARARVLLMSDPAGALAVATQAAKLLAGIDDSIVELHRIRGVEQLFPAASQKLSSLELAVHGRLTAEAQAALRAGNRSAATEKLAAVRAEEIRLVVRVLGSAAARDLLRDLDRALKDVRTRLSVHNLAGHDVSRFERMLSTATDLHNHATAALQKGEVTTALDLGSHAAGLLNSLQHLTVK